MAGCTALLPLVGCPLLVAPGSPTMTAALLPTCHLPLTRLCPVALLTAHSLLSSGTLQIHIAKWRALQPVLLVLSFRSPRAPAASCHQQPCQTRRKPRKGLGEMVRWSMSGCCASDLHHMLSDGTVPPVGGHTGAVLLSAQLFIQMQLCRKDSLRDWLRTSVEARSRRTVLLYFEQVSLAAVHCIAGVELLPCSPSNCRPWMLSATSITRV